jgi:hypothetical protein
MLFGSDLTGSAIHDVNVRFRMYFVFTVGIFALGSILLWRAQLFVASEYVEIPEHVVRSKHAKAADTSLFNKQKTLIENE